MRSLNLFVVWSVVQLASSTTTAQDAATTPEVGSGAETAAEAGPDGEVVALVESLNGGYQPISEEKLGKSRQALRSAVAASSSRLHQMSSEQRTEWMEALKWEAFVELVGADSPDLGQLNQTLIALFEDREGLEAAHWLDLRTKLERFMYLSQYAGDANAEKLYDARVTALAKAITGAAADPRGPDSQQIARVLGLLDRYEQQTATVAKIRAHYSQPNLMATVSARLASRAATRQINRSLPVNDLILGTKIRGTANTTGQITLQLLPSSNRIAAQVQLHGTAFSKNMGWNRGVQIKSRGTTSIDGRKVVYVDRHGIVTSPASANCSTQSQIDAICHDRRLVQKIAWKKACKSKSEAECIANSRAEARIRNELDNEVRQMVSDNRVKFEKDVRGPILRRNAMPEELHTWSDAQRIWVRMLQANNFQIAALGPAPFALPTTDVAVQMHESLVSNLSEGLIGGVTLTDEGLAEIFEESEREVPDELKIRDDTDPWSITFSQNRPISVKFDKETFEIVVRGSRFTRGGNTVNRDMEISARYNIERVEAGLRLVREGEVDARYVKQGPESFGDIAVKTLMRKKFSALLKEEFESSGIPLPGPLEGKAELRLASFESADGWAVVGWNMLDVEPAAAVTNPVATNGR